jgi:hypothetical protein
LATAVVTAVQTPALFKKNAVLQYKQLVGVVGFRTAQLAIKIWVQLVIELAVVSCHPNAQVAHALTLANVKQFEADDERQEVALFRK